MSGRCDEAPELPRSHEVPVRSIKTFGVRTNSMCLFRSPGKATHPGRHLSRLIRQPRGPSPPLMKPRPLGSNCRRNKLVMLGVSLNQSHFYLGNHFDSIFVTAQRPLGVRKKTGFPAGKIIPSCPSIQPSNQFHAHISGARWWKVREGSSCLSIAPPFTCPSFRIPHCLLSHFKVQEQ